jgi:two-component system chemotaxis response regulator CheB
MAASFKGRGIALVLTGTGSDGATGVKAVKRMRGTVVVQDPDTSEFPGMPRAAVDTGCVDHTAPLSRIAETLVKLVTTGEAA